MINITITGKNGEKYNGTHSGKSSGGLYFVGRLLSANKMCAYPDFWPQGFKTLGAMITKLQKDGAEIIKSEAA